MSKRIENIDIIQSTALRVSTGKILNGESLVNMKSPPINIPVLFTPKTRWAKKVDEIETPFADIYDEDEYKENQALSLMGFFEMRGMLKAFGLPTTAQTDYAREPFTNMKFFVAGCGTGREVINLAALGASVIGVDATKRYAEITAEKAERTSQILNKPLNVSLFQCPVENYPFQKDEFDGITSLFGVINHIQNWKLALSLLSQALKQEGKLVIEKYGSNDALVFKLACKGKLPYKPSILQKRDRWGRGIILGESKIVLPASFPNDDQFQKTLSNYQFDVQQRVGFLRIAALYPQVPSEQNIASFMKIVQQVDPDAWKFINQFNKPQEKLFAAFEYDLISQRRSEKPTSIEDYAYVWYKAKKLPV